MTCQAYGKVSHEDSIYMIWLLTLWTQSLCSASPRHLSRQLGVRTRMKFLALRTLLSRLSSNFPARNFSISRNTVKQRSCRWTFNKLKNNISTFKKYARWRIIHWTHQQSNNSGGSCLPFSLYNHVCETRWPQSIFCYDQFMGPGLYTSLNLLL